MSLIAFVSFHPQHFGRLFLLSTVAQGVLLALVSHRTGNIIGPWVGHGLNRSVPYFVSMVAGL